MGDDAPAELLLKVEKELGAYPQKKIDASKRRESRDKFGHQHFFRRRGRWFRFVPFPEVICEEEEKESEAAEDEWGLVEMQALLQRLEEAELRNFEAERLEQEQREVEHLRFVVNANSVPRHLLFEKNSRPDLGRNTFEALEEEEEENCEVEDVEQESGTKEDKREMRQDAEWPQKICPAGHFEGDRDFFPL